MSELLDTPTTVKTSLRPIDREGLMAFAEKGRNNPGARGTNKVHTVVDGQYRTLSYVGKHAPVVVDEPLHLFGQDTAPAPGEIALSGLGGCLAVGITAVATLYFGWHYIADDVAGVLIALVSFYVGGLASGQKFERRGLRSHPTTTTSAVPVLRD